MQLLERVAERVERVRLLYLYPSSVDDALVDAICATGVPYFDLSLQHVSRGLLKRMHRPGHRARFTELIARIRERAPEAALRSSFILGFPGETEEDHDELLGFLEEIELDWAGFFTFSEEPGTPAEGLEPAVPPELALDRLRECSELQDAVTARRRQVARRVRAERARRLARGRPDASRGAGDRRRDPRARTTSHPVRSSRSSPRARQARPLGGGRLTSGARSRSERLVGPVRLVDVE